MLTYWLDFKSKYFALIRVKLFSEIKVNFKKIHAIIIMWKKLIVFKSQIFLAYIWAELLLKH